MESSSPFVRSQALTNTLPRRRIRDPDTSTSLQDYVTRSVRRGSGFVLADYSAKWHLGAGKACRPTIVCGWLTSLELNNFGLHCGVREEESGSTSHIGTTGPRRPNPSTFRVRRDPGRIAKTRLTQWELFRRVVIMYLYPENWVRR